jgi:hypothetical protein
MNGTLDNPTMRAALAQVLRDPEHPVQGTQKREVEAYIGTMRAVLQAHKQTRVDGFLAAYSRLVEDLRIPLLTMDQMVRVQDVWKRRKGIIDDVLFLVYRLPAGERSSTCWSVLVDRCLVYRAWFEEHAELRPEAFMAALAGVCTGPMFERLIMEAQWDVLFQVWCAMPRLFQTPATRMDEQHLQRGIPVAASLLKYLLPHDVPGPFLGTKPLEPLELDWLLHCIRGGTISKAPHVPFPVSAETERAFDTFAPGAYGLGVTELLLLAELTTSGAEPSYARRIVRMLAHELGATDRIRIGRQLASMDYPAHALVRLGDMLRWSAKAGAPIQLDGRDAATIQADVNTWLQALWKDQGRINGVLKRSEVRIKEFKKSSQGLRYHLKPIIRGRDLHTEGVELRQGIFAHLPEMLERRLLVFSLRTVQGDSVTRLLTIELKAPDTVVNRYRIRMGRFPDELRVVQVRGTDDRPPTSQEVAIIKEWMWRNKLEGEVR